MKVLGLTGGIGMGKSTVAGMFAARGISAFNADEAVHELQAPHGAAIPALAAAFPGVVADGVLDRAALRAQVLADDAAMKRLEAIMHPLVRAMEGAFIAKAERAGRRAVLLDIPLLFEVGGEGRVDKIITVSCPRETQLARVLNRGVPRAQIEAIIARQMPDAEKRRRADFVVETSGTLEATQAQVARIIEELKL
ncbi:dephospho-CoA kinase [Acidocella sp. KAb 2-4]|uniref:dephospho-CoA kinase n=1 Tax=Acidocella sp. KAb 2-4 TaxID=2885158 RepID=UPI001D089373|nr:dephospho-CoA kinase [Acidocella sp. KAb 2-4]MCB5943798.1 dephospho-CoA kinase [Acidocella sp. KAb 2-4]